MEAPRGGRREVSPARDPGRAAAYGVIGRPDSGLAPRASLGGSIVNAAYLMLTTAWLAGQTQPPAAQPAPMGQPAAPAAQPAPAGTYAGPVASTSLGACNGGAWGGGCGSTNECCDSGRKGLLS